MLGDVCLGLYVISQAVSDIHIKWDGYKKTVYIISGTDYNKKVYTFRRYRVMCYGK